MSPRLTRPAFRAWLKKQPARKDFLGRDHVYCPLAVFLGIDERGYVGPASYRPPGGPMKNLPHWAQRFVLSLPVRITAPKALQILDSV